MEEKKNSLASFLSGLSVLLALVLLLCVCDHCYPTAIDGIREVFSGVEDGTVQQAFGTLAEGFENGDPIREVFSQSAQILFNEKG